MSNVREKAEAQTKQIIGQMLGDELLVREGQEQLRHAEGAPAGDQHESRADDTEDARDRGARLAKRHAKTSSGARR